MTYWQATKDSFVSLLTTWRLLPKYGEEMFDHLIDGLAALGAFLLLLVGPVLAPFAPIWAFLWMKASRDQEQSRAYAQRKIDEHYGSRHQRTQK